MTKFCPNCGEKVDEKQAVCLKCGFALPNNEVNDESVVDPNAKSKIGAGLLGIFLGALGIHNFYLGYTGKAVAQLLLTLVGWIACGLGPIAAGIWGFVEGIMILCGSIKVDANGVKLHD